MRELAELVGQTLDEKYRIERELGRGGMGTVYLATHLGTERPVAIKVISPQYMARPEFVERFRREARAAGRLRHPTWWTSRTSVLPMRMVGRSLTW